MNLSRTVTLSILLLTFIKAVPAMTVAGTNFPASIAVSQPTAGAADSAAMTSREYWVGQLVRMAYPVIRNLSENTLRRNIPVGRSASATASSREFITHMESVGRTFAGIAPWLELGPDDTPEGALRAEMLRLSHKAIANSVDPASPDYFDSHATRQILVNSAFLIQGLLRSPVQLWGGLDSLTKERLLDQWESTRDMKPGNNNWLLFSAMVECGLKHFGAAPASRTSRAAYASGSISDSLDTGRIYDDPNISTFAGRQWLPERVVHAIDSHAGWYVGDGLYGDGPVFHFDYYNSFVIQPMLAQVLEIYNAECGGYEEFEKAHRKRMVRYAGILERMIAPDGSYPLVGRSITYRLGAFQVLALMALDKTLPSGAGEGAVRSALTAAMRLQLDFQGTYDENGWLTIGICGEQKDLGDSYLSTPCLYLASLVFLPLGLPAHDTFWTVPDEPWTSVRGFSGGKVKLDRALKD